MKIYKMQSFSRSEHQNFEYFTCEEADITDDHVECAQFQDGLEDKAEELIEVNLVEEGKKLSPFLECEPINQVKVGAPRSF